MRDETNGRPATRTPEQERAEIEVTRARMSETIDEIEDALVRKKASIQDRMDVLAPVREQPMQSLGIALGAGLLLGFLTGGRKRSDVEMDGPDEEFWERRSRDWESRARRLLQIAQEQEDELESMDGRWSGDHHENGHNESGLSRLRDTVVENLSGYVSKAVEQMGR